MTQYHRPRVSREDKNALLDYASRLNGAEIRQIGDALAILTRYHEILFDGVDHCPKCGSKYLDSDWRGDIEMNGWDLQDGMYYCYRCRATFHRSEYLNPDDPENAEIPTW